MSYTSVSQRDGSKRYVSKIFSEAKNQILDQHRFSFIAEALCVAGTCPLSHLGERPECGSTYISDDTQ